MSYMAVEYRREILRPYHLYCGPEPVSDLVQEAPCGRSLEGCKSQRHSETFSTRVDTESDLPFLSVEVDMIGQIRFELWHLSTLKIRLS